MKALDLELLPRRRVPLAVWLMLLSGAVLVGDGLLRTAELREELRDSLAAASPTAGRTRASPTEALDPALARELRVAERAVEHLALPWDELFRQVEAASYERVALLAIEPDAQKRELSITGEALDYLAVLTYVARLGEHGMLTDVHLVRHEMREDAPQRPLQFTVAARWKAAP